MLQTAGSEPARHRWHDAQFATNRPIRATSNCVLCALFRALSGALATPSLPELVLRHNRIYDQATIVSQRGRTVKFVTVRELRGRTSELWDQLERQRELVVTNNGKPVAILSATDPESLERSLHNIRRCRAADAVSGLQRAAARRGLDQLTMDEVDEEIQAHRRGRKDG